MKKACHITKGIVLIILTVLIILVQSGKSFANGGHQKISPAPSERNQIPELVNQFVEERKDGLAGLGVAVLDKQGLIYSSQYGYKDIENKVKLDENAVFEWGSVSKVLVWTSLFQLEEDGLLKLDEDIRNYLPNGFLTKLSYPDGKITVVDLMNHTAGFQEVQYSMETTNSDEILNLGEALKFYEPIQIYRPGQVVSYSNWGAGLAAYIVENITGQSFDQYVHEHIFIPLGMKKTSIRADFSDNQWVKEKRSEMKSYMIMEGVDESYGESISFIQIYPAGSATGTLEDFIKFGQAFISDTSPLFNKSETRDKFLTPSRYYTGTEIPRIFHGLWTLPYGSGIIGHSGNTQGYTSSFYFDQKSSRLVLVMTNELGETAFNYGILGLVFGDLDMNLGPITEEKDISGIYTSFRSNIPNGYSKIYSYIGGILPLRRGETPRTFDLAIGQGHVEQVSDRFFIMDNGNGLTVLKNLVEDNGHLIFESFTGDERKENTISYLLKMILFLGFLLGGLISIIWLIIDLIKHIIYKIDDERSFTIKKDLLLANIMNAGVVILVLLLLFSDGFKSIDQAKPLVFLITILGISLLLLASKIIKVKGKAKWILLAILAISITNILYWQWFNFWT